MDQFVAENKNFISLFTYQALVKELMGSLVSEASFIMQQSLREMENSQPEFRVKQQAAFMLMHVVSGLQSMQPTEPIVDAETFEIAVDDIRRQFAVTDDDTASQPLALELLDWVLNKSKEEGLAALEEAVAGFPVSGGDAAVWQEHQLSKLD